MISFNRLYYTLPNIKVYNKIIRSTLNLKLHSVLNFPSEGKINFQVVPSKYTSEAETTSLLSFFLSFLSGSYEYDVRSRKKETLDVYAAIH